MNTVNVTNKSDFEEALKNFSLELSKSLTTSDGQWSIKGFIDTLKNVYTISSDTKIVSKILEIHLFPHIAQFAERMGYRIALAEHQNHYPDISFVNKADDAIRFALDLKTTYRNPKKPHTCNGFTLGSHGEYFVNRTSTKNIRFPYASYGAHFCLGLIYDRTPNATIDETRTYKVDDLSSIVSVASNFQFFVAEKWRIASDKGGSGNTANIGSIKDIQNLIGGRGTFHKLGEKWFDDYWINYRKITTTNAHGEPTAISSLRQFVEYRNGDLSLVVDRESEED
jgi:hypothetical protein